MTTQTLTNFPFLFTRTIFPCPSVNTGSRSSCTLLLLARLKANSAKLNGFLTDTTNKRSLNIFPC